MERKHHTVIGHWVRLATRVAANVCYDVQWARAELQSHSVTHPVAECVSGPDCVFTVRFAMKSSITHDCLSRTKEHNYLENKGMLGVYANECNDTRC